jgi:hypothetical protein
MLDDRILDRARRLVEAEFAKRRKFLPDKINRILRKMQIDGMDHSTSEIKAVRAACDEEIDTKAAIVWNSIQRAYKAGGVPITETLAADLKKEVNGYIEEIVKKVSELMAWRLSSRKMSAHLFDFESAEHEVKERMGVEVDLYVDSLEKKPAETEQKATATKEEKGNMNVVNISANKVQVDKLQQSGHDSYIHEQTGTASIGRSIWTCIKKIPRWIYYTLGALAALLAIFNHLGWI